VRHDSPDLPPIPQQDYSNLPNQQLGLRSRSFNYMRLSKDVEGLISNYNRVIDGFLQGVDTARLINGIRIASSGYEAPITDIGF
jgi:carnitine monooxygenase subunit